MRPPPGARSPGERAAAALVFGSSAAVLVVELVALRLLAPYLGLTLETNTLVIGLALAAIASGSWLGGRRADRVDPRRALAPLLGVSGVVVAATPSAVRASAEVADGALLVSTATICIVVPGAALSAITPMVTKLRLATLDETGTVVGRLSGIGSAGAIAGTVLTGFVLVAAVPVSGIMVGLGAALVLASGVVGWQARRWRSTANLALLVALGAAATLAAPGGCDVETRYHCVEIVADDDRDGGRVLVLDGVRHSYVDLDDPTYLDFAYVRAMASVADVSWRAGRPLDAYHLGGGGLTLPRYLAEERPGTRSVVSEIDPGVVEVDRERLGLRTGPDLEVRVEDGREGLRRLADDSRDLVVGDAFGGQSVPWHLTTAQAMADVRRVLRPDGVYVANVIDRGPLRFARAEAATLRSVFDRVALLAPPGVHTGTEGGNMVLVASDGDLDLPAVEASLRARGLTWTARSGEALAQWADDADVLTDEHAPVDQLLTLR